MARNQLIQVRTGSGVDLKSLTASGTTQQLGEIFYVNQQGSTDVPGQGLYLGTGSTAHTSSGMSSIYARPITIDGRYLNSKNATATDIVLLIDPNTGDNYKGTVASIAAAVQGVVGSDTKKVLASATDDTEGYLNEKLAVATTSANLLSAVYNSTTKKVDLDQKITSQFKITTNGLAINDLAVESTHIANNVDVSAKGFNADKVDGKDVNDSGTTNAHLWTAQKIINYIEGKLNNIKSTIYVKYAPDTTTYGRTILSLNASNQLQYDAGGGSVYNVTFPTTGEYTAQVGDLCLGYDAIEWNDKRSPVLYRVTDISIPATPVWEIASDIAIDFSVNMIIDSEIQATSTFADANYYYFVDAIDATSSTITLRQFKIETITAGLGLNKSGSTLNVVCSNIGGLHIDSGNDSLALKVKSGGGLATDFDGTYITGISGGTI